MSQLLTSDVMVRGYELMCSHCFLTSHGADIQSVLCKLLKVSDQKYPVPNTDSLELDICVFL